MCGFDTPLAPQKGLLLPLTHADCLCVSCVHVSVHVCGQGSCVCLPTCTCGRLCGEAWGLLEGAEWCCASTSYVRSTEDGQLKLVELVD